MLMQASRCAGRSGCRQPSGVCWCCSRSNTADARHGTRLDNVPAGERGKAVRFGVDPLESRLLPSTVGFAETSYSFDERIAATAIVKRGKGEKGKRGKGDIPYSWLRKLKIVSGKKYISYSWLK